MTFAGDPAAGFALLGLVAYGVGAAVAAAWRVPGAARRPATLRHARSGGIR